MRRTNFELANEWGNLVNRSISMAHKNFGCDPAAGCAASELDVDAARESERGVRDRRRTVGPQPVQAAASEAMRVVGLANKYISETEPWKLSDDPERQATVLHTALQVVDDAKTLLTPFLPHSSQQVFEALGGRESGPRSRRSGRSPISTTTSRASACPRCGTTR